MQPASHIPRKRAPHREHGGTERTHRSPLRKTLCPLFCSVNSVIRSLRAAAITVHLHDALATARPLRGPRFQAHFAQAPIDTPRIIKKWSRLRLSRAKGAKFPESASPKSNE